MNFICNLNFFKMNLNEFDDFDLIFRRLSLMIEMELVELGRGRRRVHGRYRHRRPMNCRQIHSLTTEIALSSV